MSAISGRYFQVVFRDPLPIQFLVDGYFSRAPDEEVRETIALRDVVRDLGVVARVGVGGEQGNHYRAFLCRFRNLTCGNKRDEAY